MNGRLKQATSVLLHLTGAAVGFAGLLKGSKRFIGDVEKARMPYGLPLSRRKLVSFELRKIDHYNGSL